MLTQLRLILAATIVIGICSVALAQDTRQLLSAPRPTTTAYRLLFNSVETPEGLRVVSIQPRSPVLRMESASDPGMRGILELGDIITAVDGQQVRTIEEYQAAMAASAADEGRVRLAVIDGSTAESREWVAQARRIRVPVTGPPASGLRKAHFLLIGLTEDEDIGKAMEDTLNLWQQPINSISAERHGQIRIVQGNECRAGKILAAVQTLPVAARDTVFCVYCGHGAFDPTRAIPGDPSQGHYFAIRPSGDLMRSRLSDALIAKGARLTVLISDTCNTEERAFPEEEMAEETRTVTVMGLAPFEQLLFNFRGVIDISATDFGQSGFCQPGYGSWFSAAAIPVFNFHSDWDNAFNQVRLVVDNDFQIRREKFHVMQPHLTPTKFRFEVSRDDTVTAFATGEPPQLKDLNYRVRRAVAR